MAQPGARRPPPPVAQFSHQQSQQQQQNREAAAFVGHNDSQGQLGLHSLQNSPTSSLAHNSSHHHNQHHHQHQANNSLTSTPYNQLNHRTNPTKANHNVGLTKPADALALAAQASIRPGNYRGHQRRQSVARLLPDISKLRLLSWLIEASNELINCDIAIMDGVYAKLNRSRESLLFWQSQSQSHSQPQTHSHSHSHTQLLNGHYSSCQTSGLGNKRAPPPRPPPPSVMPVSSTLAGHKAVISNKQERQPVKQQTLILIGGGSTSGSRHHASGRSKASGSSIKSTLTTTTTLDSPGSHYSLPLTHGDHSSRLAALSLRSSKTMPSSSGNFKAQGRQANERAVTSLDAMTSQNSGHAAAAAAAGQPSTPKSAARSNCSLPLDSLNKNSDNNGLQTNVITSIKSCDRRPACVDSHNDDNRAEVKDKEEEEDDDDDDDDEEERNEEEEVQQDELEEEEMEEEGEEEEEDEEDEQGEEEELEDDDDNSSNSVVSSTASSGIHETSSSDSSCSVDCSTSSTSSSGDSLSCSFDEPLAATIQSKNKKSGPSNEKQQQKQKQKQKQQQQQQQQQQQLPQVSPAEQLSERIRRAVLEHNYLQNLLVNVIRQHDRQRELLERQRRHQMILMRQHGRSCTTGGNYCPASSELLLPRIDLANIADALDDGCQCSCHSRSQSSSSSRHHSICGNSPASSLLGGGGGGASCGQRASTLPTSSSLSLSSSTTTSATNQTTSGARLLVPSRKNRRKKNCEPSREDIILRLADKLCESCFETHYWLYTCHSNSNPTLAADLTPLQEQQVESAAGASGATSAQGGTSGGSTGNLKVNATGREQSLGSGGSTGGRGSSTTSKEQQNNLDAAISLRNATFIKLVQQQVRSTISNSIELIDLIRREIKSPESIKQKQLMRCFSASIQLLTSVAGYVVPSQDISTFIQADTGPVGGPGGNTAIGNNHQRFFDQKRDQPAQLFNLPPTDFDHLLLQAALSSPTGGAHYPYGAGPGGHAQLTQKSNYHLAQAPEIPIRRRYNTLLAQRRSSNETNASPVPSHPGADAFRSLPPNASICNTGASSGPLFGPYDVSGKRATPINTIATATSTASTNPNGEDSSSGASSNNSSASSSIARNQVTQQQQPQHQQHPSLTKAYTSGAILDGKTSHDLSFEAMANLSHHHQTEDDLAGFGSGSNRSKFWQSSKFNFIKKLLQVKQQRLLRQQSKDRRIYNNKVANKFRLVMMDLTHFNRSQQLLATENGVNSLLTSMRNVLEFGLYLTVKLY